MKRYLSTLLILATLPACMPKIEDDVGIDKPDVINHNVAAATATDYDIILVGKCPTETNKVYLAAEGGEYIESLTSILSRTLGSFTGECINGSFSISYAVPNPEVERDITFNLRVKNIEGRMGAIETYVVHYKKPPATIPGFAIVSVGGVVSSNTSNYFFTSGGQTVSPILGAAAHKGLDIATSPSNAIVRYGLAGILLPK